MLLDPSYVLEENAADDPVGIAHQPERVLEALRRDFSCDHRLEIDEPSAEQLDDARPDGRRVADAPDQLEVTQREAVGGDAQLSPAACDPERDDSPALAGQPCRELERR